MPRKPRDNANSVNSEERKQYLREYYQKHKERIQQQVYKNMREMRQSEEYKAKQRQKHLDELLQRALVRFDG